MGNLVSAIITTYNRPELAKNAIRSVVSQSYHPLDIIVVEDGGNSGIEDWITEERLMQVRYHRHETNLGLAAARNTGTELATGQLIAYLDDDDEWLPNKIAKQVQHISEATTDCAVTYCGAYIVSATSDDVKRVVRPQIQGDIRTYIRHSGLVTIPSSCLFRKQALKIVGGYDETLSSHIDHSIWLRLAKHNFSAGYIDEPLVRVYEHEGYRMTKDIPARIQATEKFCRQWQPELAQWYSPQEAQQYCDRFTCHVMLMLGWSSIQENHRLQAARCFLSAIQRWPKKKTSYLGLMATLIGWPAYTRLLEIRKRLLASAHQGSRSV